MISRDTLSSVYQAVSTECFSTNGYSTVTISAPLRSTAARGNEIFSSQLQRSFLRSWAETTKYSDTICVSAVYQNYILDGRYGNCYLCNPWHPITDSRKKFSREQRNKSLNLMPYSIQRDHILSKSPCFLQWCSSFLPHYPSILCS
jgi:hypothetical protein